jgi:uncharacterized damage-inducible protein DinB
MTPPTTVAALVIRIQAAFDRFLQATAALHADELLAPRLPGGWSVKDVLAHLAWWDQWLLYTFALSARPMPDRRPPPLFDEIPTDGQWADRMNARVYEFNRTRELSEIQAAFEAARQGVLQLVQSLSDADVFDADGLSAVLGQSAAPLLLGIYEHYEEHAHAIEQLYDSSH